MVSSFYLAILKTNTRHSHLTKNEQGLDLSFSQHVVCNCVQPRKHDMEIMDIMDNFTPHPYYYMVKV
jgi:hypothetical protein